MRKNAREAIELVDRFQLIREKREVVPFGE